MSVEQNAQVAREGIEAPLREDWDCLRDLYAEDAVLKGTPEPVRGRARCAVNGDTDTANGSSLVACPGPDRMAPAAKPATQGERRAMSRARGRPQHECIFWILHCMVVGKVW